MHAQMPPMVGAGEVGYACAYVFMRGVCVDIRMAVVVVTDLRDRLARSSVLAASRCSAVAAVRVVYAAGANVATVGSCCPQAVRAARARPQTASRNHRDLVRQRGWRTMRSDAPTLPTAHTETDSLSLRVVAQVRQRARLVTER